MNRCMAFFLLLVLAAAGMTGCGKGGDKLDMNPPEITAMTPTSDASDVVLNTIVTFTFDKSVSGVSQSSVVLNAINSPSVPVNTDITYDAAAKTVTIRPKNSLAVDTYYVVAVTSDIRSETGVSMKPTSWVFTTGQATDTQSPTITKVTPAADSSFVDAGTEVAVIFSEAVIASTITADSGASAGSFRLKNLSTSAYVSCAVKYNEGSHVATLTPSSDLDDWTNYQVELTGGITDLAGNSLAGNTGFPLVYSFMTNDENSPVIINKTPSPASSAVVRTIPIKAEFSEALNETTVQNKTNFYLQNDSNGQIVPAVIAYDGTNRIAILTPSSALDPLTKYNVYLGNGITDPAGNALASASWSFTTGTDVNDTVAPFVLSTMTPQPDEKNVNPDTTLSVTFSENVTGVNASAFTLKKSGSTTAVDAKIVYSGSTHVATLSPKNSLDQNSVYTVELATAITDESGNPLIYKTWSFTTADNTKPSVVTDSTIPYFKSNIAIGTTVYVKFSERMNPSTVTDAADFKVEDVSGSIASTIGGNIVYDDTACSAMFTPSSVLEYAKTYKVSISGAKDLSGNSIIPTSWTFTTLDRPDKEAPVVEGQSPAADEKANVSATVKFMFSESIVTGCISANTVILHLGGIGGAPVPSSISYNSGTCHVTILPDAKLLYNQQYTVEVKGDVGGSEITDLSGNRLVNTSWSFTTEEDTTHPTVVFRSPENGTTGIAGNGVQIDVGFSEAVTGVTIGSFKIKNTVTGYEPSMKVTDQSNPQTNNYKYELTLTDSKNNPVPDNQSGTYAIVLTSDIKDSAGNSVTFTANSWTVGIKGKDVDAPTVILKDPTTSQVWRRNAGVYSTRVIFSETVNGVNGNSVKLERVTGTNSYETVPCDFSYVAGTRTATLAIQSDYVTAHNNLYDTTFRLTLLPDPADQSPTFPITDTAGNSFAGDQWFITTDTDTDPPTINEVTPIAEATGIPYMVSSVGPTITATFSEPIASGSVTDSTFYLTKEGESSHVGASLNVDKNIITLVPSAPLTGSVVGGALQYYVATITTGVTDKATTPVHLQGSKSWRFATKTEPDTVKPTIKVFTPANGETSITQKPECTVKFSEKMLNANASYIWITDSAGNIVSTTFKKWDSSACTATIQPNEQLTGAAYYRIVCSQNLTDLSGNAIDSSTGSGTIFSVSDGNPYVQFKAPDDTAGPTCEIKYADSANVSTTDAEGWTTWTSGNSLAVSNPRFAIVFNEPVKNVYGSTSSAMGSISLALNGTDLKDSTYVTYDSTLKTGYIQLRSDGTYVKNGILQNTGTSNIYTITISSGITDMVTFPNGLNKSGATAASDSTITFTVPDSLPYVSKVLFDSGEVSNGGSSVKYNPSNISLTFSAAMNPNKVWLELYSADTSAGHQIPVTIGHRSWSDGNLTVSFPVVGEFKVNTKYYMRLYGWSGTFEDSHGNVLDKTKNLTNGVFIFTTATADSTAPTLAAKIPAANATVGTSFPAVVLKFSEPMDTTSGTVSFTSGTGTLTKTAWMDGGCTVVYKLSGLAADTGGAKHTLSYSGFKDINGVSIANSTYTFTVSSSSVTSLTDSAEGFDIGIAADTGNMNATDSRVIENTKYYNLTSDSTYLNGSTSVGCDWYAVKKGFFQSEVLQQFSSADATLYFALAADSTWDYGCYADYATDSISLDFLTSGTYLLSFEMPHCSEYNQCDRIEVWVVTNCSSATPTWTRYATVYRYDCTAPYAIAASNPAADPTPQQYGWVWKTHYVDLSGVGSSSSRVLFRAYSSGETGANVYIDNIAVKRY